LAGVGIGVYKDIDEAVKAAFSIKKIFSPRTENVSAHQGIYQEFRAQGGILTKSVTHC